MELRRLVAGLATGILIAHGAASRAAQNDCAPPAGGFVAVEGKVEVAADETAGWRPASLTTALCEGDSVRVGPDSRDCCENARKLSVISAHTTCRP